MTMYFLRAVRPIIVDLASTFVFLAVYEVTGDLKPAILSGIAIGLVQILWALVRRLAVAPLQWASLGLVLTMGGLSLVTNDPRFIMLKPTFVDAVLAAVMSRRGWLDRYLPKIVHDHVAPEVIVRFGYAWPVLMVALGIANIYVAFNFSFEFWLWYSTLAPLLAVLALFLAEYLWLRAIIVGKLRQETPPPLAGGGDAREEAA
ncbi:MAG: septation protein IspZ [Alphaproteobacteria bacterium]